MNDRAALLKAIHERPRDGRYGIATADSYLAPLAGCFEGGLCPTGMGSVSRGEWEGAMKDAAQKFTFCEAGMNIDHKSVEDSTEQGLLLEFDCCVTSTRKDRDGDVLVTSGMSLDPAAPLLWAHSPFHPIGKLIRRTGQTSAKLTARCGIMDFGDSSGELATMARDAAVLIKGGCLRISHGFDPTEYEPLDEKDGRYKITKATILEISVVAIPSNVDAIITNFSAGKLHNPVIQKWAKSYFDARPVQGVGFGDGQRQAFTVKERLGDYEVEVTAPTEEQALTMLKKCQQSVEAKHECTCGNKAKTDLGISKESLTPKDTNMSTEAKPVETKSPETLVGPANTGVPSTDRQNSETQIPQMAQQGDSEWPGRHPSSMVRDESLVGVDSFDVGNTANDAIMAIAMGGITGPQQNPSSPATDLSMRPGPMNQSGVPTPTSGVQFPMPMQGTYDPGVSPGPQGSRAEPSLSQSVQGPKEATPTVKDANVNSGYVNYEQQCPSNANVTQAVTPLDRDSAAAHNVGSTLITAVTVNKPPEINGLPNVGKDPLIGKRLLNLKGRIEYLFKVGAISNSEHQKILAVGYASLMTVLKDYNLDPVGNGMSATLPANNVLNQPSLGNFTSVPANNSLNSSSRTGWQGSTPPSPGLPTENALNQPSMVGMGQPMQPNTPASNPPTGGKSTQGFIGTTPHEDVLNKPRTETQPAGQRVNTDGIVHERRIDPNIRENVADPNISGSLAYGYNVQGVRSNIVNENEVMEWLDAAGAPKSHDAEAKEFDDLFMQEFEAKEFDEMFAK